MNNRKQYIILLTILTASALFVGWRYTKQQNKAPAGHIVIVVDRSNSTINRCTSLSGLIKKSFNTPNIIKGSTITILGTGDPASAFEPVFVESFKIPRSNKILEGKGKAKKARMDMLAKADKYCQSLKATNHSPIFLSIKRGVEQLQSFGCKSNSNCQLWVLSDGQETANPWLSQAIKTNGNTKPIRHNQIDNSDINVVFCGLSEIQDKRKTRTVTQATALNMSWEKGFTQRNLLTFQPFCPKHILKKLADAKNTGGKK